MSQELSALPIGAKVKFGKHQVNTETPWDIVWTVVAKNHSSTPAYPTNAITLHAAEIIDLRCFDAKEPNNSNSDRVNYGNNRYDVSNMTNWLNSTAAAGSWYSAQHSADQSPNSLSYVHAGTQHASRPGFLNLFSSAERNAILTTTIRTAKPSTDGGSYEDISVKVFLPSRTEVGLGQENSISEGTAWGYYTSDSSRIGYLTQQCYNNTLSTSKPSNKSAAWHWWLRTPDYSNARIARLVFSDGSLSSGGAYYGYSGVRPALNLSSSLLVSDSTDSDGCYTFVWEQPVEPSSPTTPSIITVPTSVYGGNTIYITWGSSTDPDGDLAGYILERSVDGGAWSEIYRGVSLSHTDTSRATWGKAEYRVCAYDGRNAKSAYTDVATVTIETEPPEPPKPSGGEQEKIYIYNTAGELTEEISEVVTCTLSDKLSGEFTLAFTVQYSRLPIIEQGSLIKFCGQYYRIVRMQLDVSVGQYLLDVSCEQESISLVDEPLENFDFAGKPTVALERLLEGTGMTADAEFTETIAVSVQNSNRRSVLLEIAALCGGELEYDGHVIHVLKHRGSETVKDILTLCKHYDVRKVVDVQEETESYVVTGLSVDGYTVGDEVKLSFSPLGIDTQKRIVGIRYNPFNRTEVQIEIGDYIQDVTNDNVETSGMYLVKSEASMEFEKYINSAEGTAAISAALSGTYVTADEMGEYVTVAELDTSVQQYLNGAEGQAAIETAVSGKFLEKDALNGYATTTYVATSITQEIDRFGGTLTLSASTSTEFSVRSTYASVSGVAYGFRLGNDGYYVSANAGIDNSFAYGKFNFTNNGSSAKITLRCISYGESNYDYGIISTVNSSLAQNNSADSSNVLYTFKGKSSPSHVDIDVTIPSGSSFITFKYIKDSSQASDDDCFKIKVLLDKSSGVSSTLTLKSGSTTLSSASITFQGLVTFEALSEEGATSINGANITTGMISAERIDTSSLRAQEVWYYEQSTGSYYSVMSCSISGQNTRTMVGPKDIDNGYAQYLELYGTRIYLLRPGYSSPADDRNALMFDVENQSLVPARAEQWSLGTSDNYLYEVWAKYYLFEDGSYLRVMNGRLRYYDADGDYTNLT